MPDLDEDEITERYWNAQVQAGKLNFATCRYSIALPQLGDTTSLEEYMLHPFTVNKYLLEAGESLARYQVLNPYDLFASSLEARLRTVMDSKGPYVELPSDTDLEAATLVSWIDLIREVKLENFSDYDNGSRYCIFRNQHFVRITEHDFQIMSTMQPFLEPWPSWPHPEDVGKELTVLKIEYEKAVKFQKDNPTLANYLDSYLAKLKERNDNLEAYDGALKDWVEMYAKKSFGTPKSPKIHGPYPVVGGAFPTQGHGARPGHKSSPANSVNSIEYDTRGDIEFMQPKKEAPTEGKIDESIPETVQPPSSTKKRTRPRRFSRVLSASDSALSSVPDSNEWVPSDDNKGDDDDDEDLKTPTKASASSKRRRTAPTSSLQIGVRTRLTLEEKAHGFTFIDPLLKEGSTWLDITNRYNVEFSTRRTVGSVKAVWDRLSLHPGSTEGATAMTTPDLEPVSYGPSPSKVTAPSPSKVAAPSPSKVAAPSPPESANTTVSPQKKYGDGNAEIFSVNDK